MQISDVKISTPITNVIISKKYSKINTWKLQIDKKRFYK